MEKNRNKIHYLLSTSRVKRSVLNTIRGNPMLCSMQSPAPAQFSVFLNRKLQNTPVPKTVSAKNKKYSKPLHSVPLSTKHSRQWSRGGISCSESLEPEPEKSRRLKNFHSISMKLAGDFQTINSLSKKTCVDCESLIHKDAKPTHLIQSLSYSRHEEEFLRLFSSFHLFPKTKEELSINRELLHRSLPDQAVKSFALKKINEIISEIPESSSIEDLDGLLSKITQVQRSLLRGIMEKIGGSEELLGFEKIWILSIKLIEKSMDLQRKITNDNWIHVVNKVKNKFKEYEDLVNNIMKRWTEAEDSYLTNLKRLTTQIEVLKRENSDIYATAQKYSDVPVTLQDQSTKAKPNSPVATCDIGIMVPSTTRIPHILCASEKNLSSIRYQISTDQIKLSPKSKQ